MILNRTEELELGTGIRVNWSWSRAELEQNRTPAPAMQHSPALLLSSSSNLLRVRGTSCTSGIAPAPTNSVLEKHSSTLPMPVLGTGVRPWEMEAWIYSWCPADFSVVVQFNLFGSKYQQKIELRGEKKHQQGVLVSLRCSRAWEGLPGDPTPRSSSEAGKCCCTAGFALPALPNPLSNTSTRNQISSLRLCFLNEQHA